MTSDSICIFYIVYERDWPNLYMSLKSINKNWLGPKNVAFISQDNNYDFIDKFVKSILQGWTIHQVIPIPLALLELEPEKYSREIGWFYQQIYKLYLPTTFVNQYEWMLNLDCKNILIRPCSPITFIQFNINSMKYTISVSGTLLTGGEQEFINNHIWYEEIYKEGKELTNGTDIDIVPYTMSPWVFNCNMANILWNNLKPWEWTVMKSTEYILYWYSVNYIYEWNINGIPLIGTCLDKGHQINNINENTLIYNTHIDHFHNYGLEVMNYLISLNILNYEDCQFIQKLVN